MDLLERYHSRIHDKAGHLGNSEILTPALTSRLHTFLLDTDVTYSNVKTELRIKKNKLALPMQSNAHGRKPESNPLDSLHLKRITVERFNGDYKKWPNFKSIFCQFFHDNTQLNDLTKFFRLDEHIEKDSEAYNLISGFDRVSDNYQLAWNQLYLTYDNKRKLVDEMISGFIDMPLMPSATRGNMMIIINAINHLTKSLIRYEEVKVEGWDPILVNLLMRKLDTET